jgi:D-glycero-D-manno-heptose 1,7-bisphosphate phosphatase
LEDIWARFQLDLTGVPCVGDSYRDLVAARAVGAVPILVRTGKGERTLRAYENELADVAVFPDLAAFADALLGGA